MGVYGFRDGKLVVKKLTVQIISVNTKNFVIAIRHCMAKTLHLKLNYLRINFADLGNKLVMVARACPKFWFFAGRVLLISGMVAKSGDFRGFHSVRGLFVSFH